MINEYDKLTKELERKKNTLKKIDAVMCQDKDSCCISGASAFFTAIMGSVIATAERGLIKSLVVVGTILVSGLFLFHGAVHYANLRVNRGMHEKVEEDVAKLTNQLKEVGKPVPPKEENSVDNLEFWAQK